MPRLRLVPACLYFYLYFDVSLFRNRAGWEAKVINRRMVFINHTTKVCRLRCGWRVLPFCFSYDFTKHSTRNQTFRSGRLGGERVRRGGAVRCHSSSDTVVGAAKFRSGSRSGSMPTMHVYRSFVAAVDDVQLSWPARCLIADNLARTERTTSKLTRRFERPLIVAVLSCDWYS